MCLRCLWTAQLNMMAGTSYIIVVVEGGQLPLP
jgi:hypothetical protein